MSEAAKKERISVLLVEDDRDDFVLTEELLQSVEGQEYAVSWSASYESALRELMLHKFDVALVDYQIGARTGLDFISRIGPDYPHCPMILLTGLRSHDIDLAAQEAGAADYLVKDSLTEELLDRSIRYARHHAQRWSLLDSVLNNASVGMVALDEAGKPIVWNPQAFAALSLAEPYCRSEASDEIARALVELSSGDQLPAELVARNGETYELTKNFVSNSGPIIAFHNITRRAQAEEFLRKAVEEAESTSAAKSNFFATMSHELRTPLNGILGMVRVLENSITDPAQREHLDSIANSGAVLLSMVNDILDISKIEAGQMQLEKIEFDIAMALDEATRLTAPGAYAKGLELVAQIDPLVPKKVVGDPMRLQHVLTNLIGNAIKFTREGSVVVKVETTHADEILGLKISITDTGIGIPEDRIDVLFDRFVQADETITRKYGGTGLGLALCKEIVTLMGGEIACQSAQGVGSTFSFTIPAGVLAVDHEPIEEAAGRSLHQTQTVLISRSPAVAEQISAHIQARGGICKTVQDADEAIELVSAFELDNVIYDGADGAPLDQALAEAIEAGCGGRQPALWGIGRFETPGDMTGGRASGVFERPFSTANLERLALARQSRGASQGTSGSFCPVPPERPLRVLVVEDNVPNQRVAEAILKTSGFEPEIATNGITACRLVECQTYDAILMDVQMPEMDGLEATQLIRSMENGRGVPIIGLSANVNSPDRQSCLEAGMNQHIAKPVDWDRLVSMLHALGTMSVCMPT